MTKKVKYIFFKLPVKEVWVTIYLYLTPNSVKLYIMFLHLDSILAKIFVGPYSAPPCLLVGGTSQ